MIVTAAIVVGVVVLLRFATSSATGGRSEPPASWSLAVTRICAHALLFDGRHEIGTRAGALAVARDIRASTQGRLARVEHLAPPAGRTALADRWLDVERRLASTYATSYVRIFEVIDAADTPRERAREPLRLGRLLHAPDALGHTAAALDAALHIPDCTGGTPMPSGNEPAQFTHA